MFERMKLREGFMFSKVQYQWREQRMKNLSVTVDSVWGEAVTIDIVPPWEQKLLNCSEK